MKTNIVKIIFAVMTIYWWSGCENYHRGPTDPGGGKSPGEKIELGYTGPIDSIVAPVMAEQIRVSSPAGSIYVVYPDGTQEFVSDVADVNNISFSKAIGANFTDSAGTCWAFQFLFRGASPNYYVWPISKLTARIGFAGNRIFLKDWFYVSALYQANQFGPFMRLRRLVNGSLSSPEHPYDKPVLLQYRIKAVLNQEQFCQMRTSNMFIVPPSALGQDLRSKTIFNPANGYDELPGYVMAVANHPAYVECTFPFATNQLMISDSGLEVRMYDYNGNIAVWGWEPVVARRAWPDLGVSWISSMIRWWANMCQPAYNPQSSQQYSWTKFKDNRSGGGTGGQDTIIIGIIGTGNRKVAMSTYDFAMLIQSSLFSHNLTAVYYDGRQSMVDRKLLQIMENKYSYINRKVNK